MLRTVRTTHPWTTYTCSHTVWEVSAVQEVNHGTSSAISDVGDTIPGVHR